MTSLDEKKKTSTRLFLGYALGIIIVWSLFIGASIRWQKRLLKNSSIEAARIEARKMVTDHVVYRSWNAIHGGVYALVTPDNQPNPYLSPKEREITTPSGSVLTKVNPAYMTRQVSELAFKQYGIISHITSLNPIRPENKADTWEQKALEKFEQGKKEVSSLEWMDKIQYLRLMRPLRTEESCLKCHAAQGYRTGDIRGGISVAVPVSTHIAVNMANLKTLYWMFGLLWFAGVLGTIIFMYALNNQIEKRLEAEEELIKQEKLQGVVEMARAVCHELNQPLQTILGNSEIVLMEGTDKETLVKRVNRIKEEVERMSALTRKLIKIASYKTKDMPQGKVIDIEKSVKKD